MNRKSFFAIVLVACTSIFSACGSTASSSLSEPSSSSSYVDGDETDIRDDDYRNFYEVYVRSYYDYSGDGIGDLKGVESKLDYIKSTGYDGIWLMPINQSPSYHKYNVADYYSIDAEYGTMDDLESLIAACHERGIRLIMDLVMNHSSRSCEWFTTAVDAYSKQKAGMEMTADETLWASVYSFADSSKTGYSSVTGNYGQKFYVESNFDSDMPEFNFGSSKANDLLRGVMKYYLDLGIDGFRLDAVKYFYNGNTDKNCQVLKKYHDYATSINEDAYFVGECWDSSAIISKYYAGSGCESFFWFEGSTGSSSLIMSAMNMSGGMQANYLKTMKDSIKAANGQVPAPFLDNHDMSRFSVKKETKTKFGLGLLAMMNGATFNYYGDEIGLTGTVKPDQNVRKHMWWSSEDDTGRCIDPSGASSVEYLHPDLETQQNDENSIYNYEKKALLQRNRFPGIARGEILDTSACIGDDDTLTYYTIIDKSYEDTTIRIVINFSVAASVEYDMSGTGFTSMAGRLAVDTENQVQINGSVVTLPPFGIAILK